MLLALADAVLVVAGVLVAISRAGAGRVVDVSGGDGAPSAAAAGTAADAEPVPARRPVTAADVLERPQPAMVTAKGRWSASLEGTGERVRFFAPVVAVGALPYTTVRLVSPDPRPVNGADGSVRYTAGTALAFPDGTRWYPLEPLRVEGSRGSTPLAVGATAVGGEVRGTVDGSEVVRVLDAGGEARGRFVRRDGQEATTVRFPRGTRLSPDCAGRTPADVPTPCSGPAPTPAGQIEVSIEAQPGLTVHVDTSEGSSYGNGEGGVEIEVAGALRAKALGRTWDGLVGSLEADDLKATVTWSGHGWTVDASARSARQLWMDVWPVVGTTLEVTSGYDGGPHSCRRDCSVRLRYRNVGHATAQIFEAEALGGSNAVALGIKQTGTHDAGLDVHRGGYEVNLLSGRGIDSHLPPGYYHDRGLTATAGVPVDLVLRGNFPEVRVTLAIPSSRT